MYKPTHEHASCNCMSACFWISSAETFFLVCRRFFLEGDLLPIGKKVYFFVVIDPTRN